MGFMVYLPKRSKCHTCHGSFDFEWKELKVKLVSCCLTWHWVKGSAKKRYTLLYSRYQNGFLTDLGWCWWWYPSSATLWIASENLVVVVIVPLVEVVHVPAWRIGRHTLYFQPKMPLFVFRSCNYTDKSRWFSHQKWSPTTDFHRETMLIASAKFTANSVQIILPETVVLMSKCYCYFYVT